MELNKSVSAVYLFDKNDKALMQLRDNIKIRNSNMWVPPGGHKNKGENSYDCAIREFFEETGYFCKKLFKVGSIIENNENYGDLKIFFFTARYDQIQNIECYEGQMLKFLSIEQIQKLNHPKYIIKFWKKAIKILN